MYKLTTKILAVVLTCILAVRDWIIRKYIYIYIYIERNLRHTGVDKTNVCYSCVYGECYRYMKVRLVKFTSKYPSIYKKLQKKPRRRYVNLYHALYSSVLAMQSIWSRMRILRMIHLNTGLTVEACMFWIWKTHFKYRVTQKTGTFEKPSKLSLFL